jgi:multimeric flavodoxin WrbA
MLIYNKINKLAIEKGDYLMAKVLGISGSPRNNGNTFYALKHALDVLDKRSFETKYISLSGKNIHPCISCWKCAADGKCWQNDDMTEIIDALMWCDGIIIGSPVYFGMVSGQLKTMMDRCVCIRAHYGDNFPLSGKVGGAIACANSRNGGQETTLQNIQTFLLQMNFQVASDGPRYCHSGGTIMSDANKDSWGLETVRNLANNIGNMLIHNNK